MLYQPFSSEGTEIHLSVFLDRSIIDPGTEWARCFLNAITHSVVITPVISLNLLKQIHSKTFDPDELDNLIVEFLIALMMREFSSHSNVRAIIPFLVGDRDDLTFKSTIFTRCPEHNCCILECIPDLVLIKSNELAVNETIQHLRIELPQSVRSEWESLSIRSILQRLTKRQAVCCWDYSKAKRPMDSNSWDAMIEWGANILYMYARRFRDDFKQEFAAMWNKSTTTPEPWVMTPLDRMIVIALGGLGWFIYVYLAESFSSHCFEPSSTKKS